MTTNEIADVIITSLADRSFPVFLTTFAGQGFSEADVLGINTNGLMYEFEIKRSRSDFLNDFRSKQWKHKKLKEGDAVVIYNEYRKGKKTGNKLITVTIPNRFFFACEPGLIKPAELPDYCGLVYITKERKKVDGFTEMKSAPLIHRERADERIYKRVATILSQRIIYGCSFYTHKHPQLNK